MARTYIKLNIQFKSTEEEAGIYFDAISCVKPFSADRTLIYFDAGMAFVNKPLAEVEDMLAEINKNQPAQLDWREITGEPKKAPAPPKAPQQKKGLGHIFGH